LRRLVCTTQLVWIGRSDVSDVEGALSVDFAYGDVPSRDETPARVWDGTPEGVALTYTILCCIATALRGLGHQCRREMVRSDKFVEQYGNIIKP
jgi:hypothetical protein